MSNSTDLVYLDLFKEELENIGKLAETPNLMREVAIAGIDYALKQKLNYAAQMSLQKTKKSLENISESSISSNYRIIYNQMGILAVSSMEATLKNFFRDKVSKLDNLNVGNKKLEEIKITALDLVNHNLDFSQEFGELLLEKETNSFQNLKLIKETFRNYLNKEIALDDASEKLIIFYLESRHLLVHKSGRVDDRFVSATSKMSANINNYKIGDKVEFDEKDWNNMKTVFVKLVEKITS